MFQPARESMMKDKDKELLQAIQESSDIDDLAFQFQTTVSGMARRLSPLMKKNLVYRYHREVWLTDEGKKIVNEEG